MVVERIALDGNVMKYQTHQTKLTVQPTRKTLTEQQAEHLREAYEERRAILEFDGGYTRAEADRLAWLMVYCKFYAK